MLGTAPHSGLLASELLYKMSAVAFRCDEWLERYASEFDPFAWTTKEERYLRRKAFAELGLYLYVREGTDERDRSAPLRDMVIARSNDRRYAELIARHPRQLLLYSSGPLFCKRFATVSAGLQQAIEAVLAGKTVWALERLPHRILDFWHFCKAFGSDSPLDHQAVLSVSSLAYAPSVVDCTLSDAYALTHVQLFYYNFGISHPDFPNEHPPYDIADVLEGLILRYLAEDNYDIVLELLMTGVMHRQLHPSVVALVVNMTYEQVQRCGFVPGPKGIQEEGVDHCSREWSANYHTVLVAASAMRIVMRDWERMGERLPLQARHEQAFQSDEALLLGEALSKLGKYQLPLAVAYLDKLLDSPVSKRFAPAFREAADYVSNQRCEDGTYGFWTDEEKMYETKEQHSSFDTAVRQPVAELCQQFVSRSALRIFIYGINYSCN